MGEKTDASTLIDDLNKALPLVARDAVAAAMAAGTIPGPEGIALSWQLRETAADETRDVERLAARIASLGGKPTINIGAIKTTGTWRTIVKSLVTMQQEALDAVVAAIPADADDAEGEATEHLLEHVVARKRDAIELPQRAYAAPDDVRTLAGRRSVLKRGPTIGRPRHLENRISSLDSLTAYVKTVPPSMADQAS